MHRNYLRPGITLLVIICILIAASFAFASSATYTYDANNRLVRIEQSSAQWADYTYDPVGNRTEVSIAAQNIAAA